MFDCCLLEVCSFLKGKRGTEHLGERRGVRRGNCVQDERKFLKNGKKKRKKESRLFKVDEEQASKQQIFHGLCTSSILQVPAQLEFLPWLLSVNCNSGYVG